MVVEVNHRSRHSAKHLNAHVQIRETGNWEKLKGQTCRIGGENGAFPQLFKFREWQFSVSWGSGSREDRISALPLTSCVV